MHEYSTFDHSSYFTLELMVAKTIFIVFQFYVFQ